ncbi:MAG: HNH endonuclease [Verrucomicrobia bacterium]|nr:HNH endonuclease [Verrucomicrobiota bacterium]
MSAEWIPVALRTEVQARAAGLCEYCRVHEDDAGLPREPDHIVADQHDGRTTSENLGP